MAGAMALATIRPCLTAFELCFCSPLVVDEFRDEVLWEIICSDTELLGPLFAKTVLAGCQPHQTV
jgi:hypothetical protein